MQAGSLPRTRGLLLRRAEQIELDCRKAILSLLEYSANAILEDLGYGDGAFTTEAAKKIGTRLVYSLDKEEQNIRAARQKGIQGLQADLDESIPLASRSADVVCAIYCIEHLNSTDVFLKEIHRILKESGYLIIATPNLAAWHHVFFLMLGKQPTIAEVSDEVLVGTWSPRGNLVSRVGPGATAGYSLQGP